MHSCQTGHSPRTCMTIVQYLIMACLTSWSSNRSGRKLFLLSSRAFQQWKLRLLFHHYHWTLVVIGGTWKYPAKWLFWIISLSQHRITYLRGKTEWPGHSVDKDGRVTTSRKRTPGAPWRAAVRGGEGRVRIIARKLLYRRMVHC